MGPTWLLVLLGVGVIGTSELPPGYKKWPGNETSVPAMAIFLCYKACLKAHV